MCKPNEKKNLLHHATHCYPRASAYLVVMTTLILLFVIYDAVKS